jgi:hypothetical protein
MTRKNSIIALIVVLISLGSAWFLLVYKKGDNNIFSNKNISGEKSCPAGDTVGEKGQCITPLESALNEGKLSSCRGLNSADRDACENGYKIKEIADNKTVDSCKELKSEGMQAACVDQFWFSKAIRVKDNKLCDNIKNESDKAACKESLK